MLVSVVEEPKNTFLFRNLVASLVKHFRTGLVAFFIIYFFRPICCSDSDVYIYDSQGPDLSDFDKEGNRRDSSGYIMAVEDGV